MTFSARYLTPYGDDTHLILCSDNELFAEIRVTKRGNANVTDCGYDGGNYPSQSALASIVLKAMRWHRRQKMGVTQ